MAPKYSLADALAQRDAAMKKLEGTYQEQYDAEQRAYDEEKAKLSEQEKFDQTNWVDDMSQGAAAGSQFGPWGALIGGIIGDTKGRIGAYNARRDRGQGKGEAAWRSFFDFKPLFDKRNTNTLVTGGMMAGKGIAANRAQQRMGAQEKLPPKPQETTGASAGQIDPHAEQVLNELNKDRPENTGAITDAEKRQAGWEYDPETGEWTEPDTDPITGAYKNSGNDSWR